MIYRLIMRWFANISPSNLDNSVQTDAVEKNRDDHERYNWFESLTLYCKTTSTEHTN